MEQNIQELWGDYKRCNILVVGIPAGEKERRVGERQRERERALEREKGKIFRNWLTQL